MKPVALPTELYGLDIFTVLPLFIILISSSITTPFILKKKEDTKMHWTNDLVMELIKQHGKGPCL
jgi:hypothetical protein